MNQPQDDEEYGVLSQTAVPDSSLEHEGRQIQRIRATMKMMGNEKTFRLPNGHRLDLIPKSELEGLQRNVPHIHLTSLTGRVVEAGDIGFASEFNGVTAYGYEEVEYDPKDEI